MGEIAKRPKGEGDQPEAQTSIIPTNAGIPVGKKKRPPPPKLSSPRKRGPIWCHTGDQPEAH